VTRLYDDALGPLGLGANQYSILAQLDHAGPSAIGDLADQLVMDRSTLGHLLRPLEKRHLVGLDVPDHDGRTRIAALTPSGRTLVASGHPLWARAQQRFADAVGKDDAIELRTVLKHVASADF
jgi:DNA-binding MarR family transcriptional regulator